MPRGLILFACNNEGPLERIHRVLVVRGKEINSFRNPPCVSDFDIEET